MRAKHVPTRRCTSCRRSRPQRELIRFYRDADGNWQLDATGKSGGRGSWLCRDTVDCQNLRTLGRFFRGQAVSVAQQLNSYLLSTPQEEKSPTTGGMNVR